MKRNVKKFGLLLAVCLLLGACGQAQVSTPRQETASGAADTGSAVQEGDLTRPGCRLLKSLSGINFRDRAVRMDAMFYGFETVQDEEGNFYYFRQKKNDRVLYKNATEDVFRMARSEAMPFWGFSFDRHEGMRIEHFGVYSGSLYMVMTREAYEGSSWEDEEDSFKSALYSFDLATGDKKKVMEMPAFENSASKIFFYHDRIYYCADAREAEKLSVSCYDLQGKREGEIGIEPATADARMDLTLIWDNRFLVQETADSMLHVLSCDMEGNTEEVLTGDRREERQGVFFEADDAHLYIHEEQMTEDEDWQSILYRIPVGGGEPEMVATEDVEDFVLGDEEIFYQKHGILYKKNKAAPDREMKVTSRDVYDVVYTRGNLWVQMYNDPEAWVYMEEDPEMFGEEVAHEFAPDCFLMSTGGKVLRKVKGEELKTDAYC